MWIVLRWSKASLPTDRHPKFLRPGPPGGIDPKCAGGRACNHTQDLARRSLLLQRLLEFVEQPHVLDGDDRLVGEGFEQPNLRRGEGVYLGATCGQYPKKFPVLTEGSG